MAPDPSTRLCGECSAAAGSEPELWIADQPLYPTERPRHRATATHAPDGTRCDWRYRPGSYDSSCRLRVQRHTLFVVRVDDRTEPCGNGGTTESKQSVFGS